MEELQTRHSPPSPPYLAFTLDTPDHIAKDLFSGRYGQPPEKILRLGTALLAGPIPPNAKKTITTAAADARHTS